MRHRADRAANPDAGAGASPRPPGSARPGRAAARPPVGAIAADPGPGPGGGAPDGGASAGEACAPATLGTGGLLLDLTRSISRAGTGPLTGIDRVERAYHRHFLGRPEPVHFLVRVAGGQVLLDRAGGARLLACLEGSAPWGPLDLIGRLSRRLAPAQRRAQATVRGLGGAPLPPARIGPAIARRLPGALAYVNVGHANLAPALVQGVKRAGPGVRIAVMIHDAIPLETPELVRPETPDRFRLLLETVARGADLLIHNSADTAARVKAQLDRLGLPRPGAVMRHLGTDPLPPLPEPPPASGPPGFVVLGTIEPRKNHLLLLNLWRQFEAGLPQARVPHLHIVGRRGWECENVLDALDRAPFMGRSVFEHGPLDDGALAGLLARAHGLLFPSLSEGYGYPALEAVQAGLPVIASDLPSLREVLGDAAIWRDPLDGPGWAAAILDLAARPRRRHLPPPPLPDWDGHFAGVLPAIAALWRSPSRTAAAP